VRFPTPVKAYGPACPEAPTGAVEPPVCDDCPSDDGDTAEPGAAVDVAAVVERAASAEAIGCVEQADSSPLMQRSSAAAVTGRARDGAGRGLVLKRAAP
jgi:hypothetical protein